MCKISHTFMFEEHRPQMKITHVEKCGFLRHEKWHVFWQFQYIVPLGKMTLWSNLEDWSFYYLALLRGLVQTFVRGGFLKMKVKKCVKTCQKPMFLNFFGISKNDLRLIWSFENVKKHEKWQKWDKCFHCWQGILKLCVSHFSKKRYFVIFSVNFTCPWLKICRKNTSVLQFPCFCGLGNM